MRIFIFLLLLSLFISLPNISKAHNLLNYSIDFSSEESFKKVTISDKNTSSTIPNKNIQPTTQKTTTKEQKKAAKQKRKQFRKTIWKTIKEQRKINKENKKNKTKASSRKIHWAAYLAFFGALLALGIFVAAIAVGTMYAFFSYLVPFAILLLPISIISSIIGVSVVSNDKNEKYDKTYTLTLALVGGIISLISLLFIILLIIALSSLTF